MGLLRIVVAVLAGAFALTSCGEQYPFPVVPPPELGDGPITLRVVRALNPRFPKMSEAEFADVLGQASVLVKDHFGLDVRFERGRDYAIDELFLLIPDPALENTFRTMYRFPGLSDTPELLVEFVTSVLEFDPLTTAQIVKAVAPKIPGATRVGTGELAQAFADIWVQGLVRWQGLLALDGEPVISPQGFHQFSLWDHLGYADIPYDVVITNQLVASAQLYSFDAPASLRGGMIKGVTGFSHTGQFDAYSMVSTFSTINDLGDLNELGPDPVFKGQDATRYTALNLARELGFMLLGFSFTSFNPACIMFEAPIGAMKSQLETLDADKCPIGSDPATTPGAAAVQYNRFLLEEIERQ